MSDLVGKRVIVRSYRVVDATGVADSYVPVGNWYWIKLDKPIKNMRNGKMSVWHKCNARNVKEVTE